MRKLMMPAAMLAMTVLVAIAPVLAQNEGDQPESTVVSPPVQGSETQEVTPPVTEETEVEAAPPPPPPPDLTALSETTTPSDLTVLSKPTTLQEIGEQQDDAGDDIAKIAGQKDDDGEAEQGGADREANSGPIEVEVEEQKANNDGDTEQGGKDQEANSGDDEVKVEAQKNDKDDGDAKQEARNQKDDDADDEDADDEDADDEDADDEDADDEDADEGDSVEQDTNQEADSGDVDQAVDVINTGDYVNQCVAVLQAANTGNSQNAQGVAQDDSEADDIGADGGGINVSPQIVQDCRQIILQIVTVREPRDRIAGSRERAAIIRKAYAGRPEAVQTRVGQARDGQASVGQARIGQSRVGQASVGQARIGQNRIIRVSGQPNAAARPKTLPRTGGFSGSDAALLGLGAGVLITAGGLLIRKTSR